MAENLHLIPQTWHCRAGVYTEHPDDGAQRFHGADRSAALDSSPGGQLLLVLDGEGADR